MTHFVGGVYVTFTYMGKYALWSRPPIVAELAKRLESDGIFGLKHEDCDNLKGFWWGMLDWT